MDALLELIKKADLQVADLVSDGGYMPKEQAASFVKKLIKQATMMGLVDVRGQKSHTGVIDKIGISGRVLRPGTSGQALSVADRTKPVTEDVELETKLMKGQVNLTDEVLEDNIEQGTLKQTIMSLMSEAVAYDMDDLMINGDTTNTTDSLLALFDGAIKLATSNVVNAGTVELTKAHLKAALKAMPSQYNRTRGAQRFLTSEDAEIDYRDYLSDRGTGMGDKNLEDDAPIRYVGRPLLGIPCFPDNLGGSNNCTNVLLTDPKNIRWGIWRKIKMETGRDIEAGVYMIVVTVRAGVAYREEDAVVKIENVKTAA